MSFSPVLLLFLKLPTGYSILALVLPWQVCKVVLISSKQKPLKAGDRSTIRPTVLQEIEMFVSLSVSQENYRQLKGFEDS